MSATPYRVTVDHFGDRDTIECATFEAMLLVARTEHAKHPGRVHVWNDDRADGGYGEDGTEWRDGLTEGERERVREALA